MVMWLPKEQDKFNISILGLIIMEDSEFIYH